jgi:ABC-type glycerol-3-phosphate transport system substrate-binding protein
VAFTFSSTGNSVLYAEAYDGATRSGVTPFRYRQVMIPQADPQNPGTALFGASFFVVQSDPVRQEAAWRFIRWFTEAPQLARWAMTAQALPFRISALELMTDTLEAYPFFRSQVEQILPYATPEPAIPEQLELRDLLYTAILSVTYGYDESQVALDRAARQADTLLSGGP